MSKRTIYLLAVFVIACLFAATAYVAVLIVARQEELWKTTRFEDPWVASQALVEFTRLEQRISAFGVPVSGINKDEVELRFDVVLGRVKLLSEGEFQRFIERDPEHRKVVEHLVSAVAAAEPLIQQIEHPGSIQKLLAILSSLGPQLTSLTSAALNDHAERVAEDQRNLTHLHLIFAALLGALAVSGIAIFIFLYWHNKALERARKDIGRSATAAREAHHRFETTLENMDQGILMYDASGVIRVYNRKAVELLDLPEELMASQPSFQALREYQLAQGEFSQSDESFRQWVARSGFKDTPDTYERERPNGTVLEVRTVPLLDGGAVRTFTNITERKQAETQLRQANETLTSLISASPIAIISVKTDLTIDIWNPAAEKIFGYTAEEIIGRRYDLLVPGEEAKTIHTLFERFNRGEVLHDNRVQRRRKDGLLVEADASGAGLFTAKGELHGAVIMLEDITQRQRLEEQLRQSQKMDAVGQLTGGVAHDFNNILGIILGNVELMADDPDLAPRLRETAELIANTAERGSRLTHHLLAFSRQQALAPEPLDINQVITDLTKLLSRSLGEEIEIRTRLAANLPKALVDHAELESALVNLSVNARDAMPKGGRLLLETKAVTVDGEEFADRLAPGSYIRVAVTDNGTGMPPEVVARVFEPFYTTKGVGKGSGLGLAMVYGFAKQSQGHIEICSEPGMGTTISLYLPLVDKQTVHAETGREDAASEVSNGTILLVEDEPAFRHFIAHALEKLHYEVVVCMDGPSAWAEIENGLRPDLLLTDVILPGGMNGREIAERIHQHDHELPVVFMSGYPDTILSDRGTLSPNIRLLRKPFRKVQLAQAIHSALAASRSQRLAHPEFA